MIETPVNPVNIEKDFKTSIVERLAILKELDPVSPRKELMTLPRRSTFPKNNVYRQVYNIILGFIAISSSVSSLQRLKNERNLFNKSKNSQFKGGDSDEILNFWKYFKDKKEKY